MPPAFDHLLLAFQYLPTTTVTFADNSSTDAIYNTSTYRDRKVFGGLSQDHEATAFVKTAYTPSDIAAGQLVTINGQTMRIAAVTQGKWVSQLFLIAESTQ